MKTELCCPVCHDYFSEPVGLWCHHHICASHVESLSKGKTLVCPSCEDVTTLPTEGALQIDRSLQLVVEAWLEQIASQHENKNETPALVTPTCGFCEEQLATCHCEQCDGVLCEKCRTTLHTKGIFKTHTVVELLSKQSKTKSGGEVDHFAAKMLCNEHAEEKLNFYCLDCQRPVCSHCLILGSHKGHQQQPIDQAYETGKGLLTQWVDRLRQHAASAEDLLDRLRGVECEVQHGAEGQRHVINGELDHLREVIETKRHQLLSKSALEEKQKRVQLQSQLDRASAQHGDMTELLSRSGSLLETTSEHTFLAVLLPMIQDMKKCSGQPVDTTVHASSNFSSLSTDAQVRSLGDLDLGHPKAPTVSPSPSPAIGGAIPGITPMIAQPAPPQVQLPQQRGNFSVMQPNFNHAQAGVGMGMGAPTMPHVGAGSELMRQQVSYMQASISQPQPQPQTAVRGPTVVYYHNMHGV